MTFRLLKQTCLILFLLPHCLPLTVLFIHQYLLSNPHSFLLDELSERIEKLIRLEQVRLAEKEQEETNNQIGSDNHYSRYSSQSEYQAFSPGHSSLGRNGGGGFEYSSADFGPLLSSSVASTSSKHQPETPTKSFAKMAMASPSSTTSPWSKILRSPVLNGIAIEDPGSGSSSWKLEIPESLLTSAVSSSSPTSSVTNQTPFSTTPTTPNGTKSSGKKKKPQKVLLIGNSGSRGALFTH